MKTSKKSIFFVVGLLLSLSACSSGGASSSVSSSDEKSVSSSESSSSISSESSRESSRESSSESSSSSSSSSHESKLKEGDVYHFYAVNDFHGAVVEQYNGNYYEPGIRKVFGKLKALKDADPEHSFVFSAGDMWQGSFASNFNYGNMVTESMNEAFDAMVLGNHEFDYGQDKIVENQEIADFPILCGNALIWDEGETDERWDKTEMSTIIERGDLRLGVIGLIGYGQTSSIESRHVSDIYFPSYAKEAAAEATRLREEEGCDSVILLLHNEAKTVKGWTYSSSFKNYFDGVFCGHTHRKEQTLVNGAPCVQAYCNGEAISYFDLTWTGGAFVCSGYGVLSGESSWPESEYVDSVVEKYEEDPTYQAKATAVAGTLTGSALSSSVIPNVFCKAAYEKFSPKYPDLVACIHNTGRASVATGEVTYLDMYKALPFMNSVVIIKAKGSEIRNEANSNTSYCGDMERFSSLDSDTYYTCLTISYIAYHQNNKKDYDYFYGLNYGTDVILEDYAAEYPVDIAFDYLSSLGGTFYSGDFIGTENGFGLTFA